MSLTPNVKLSALLFLVVLTFSAGDARAETYSEIEPNNTFATANFFPTSNGFLRITGTTGSQMPGSVDYFQFLASAGTPIHLTATVTGFASLQDPPIIRLGLLSPSGATLAEVQSGSGATATAIINFSVLQDGLYGANIRPPIGCECTFSYQLDITGVTSSSTPVPEPMTVLLLGTGLVGIAAKVRRRV